MTLEGSPRVSLQPAAQPRACSCTVPHPCGLRRYSQRGSVAVADATCMVRCPGLPSELVLLDLRGNEVNSSLMGVMAEIDVQKLC